MRRACPRSVELRTDTPSDGRPCSVKTVPEPEQPYPFGGVRRRRWTPAQRASVAFAAAPSGQGPVGHGQPEKHRRAAYAVRPHLRVVMGCVESPPCGYDFWHSTPLQSRFWENRCLSVRNGGRAANRKGALGGRVPPGGPDRQGVEKSEVRTERRKRPFVPDVCIGVSAV